VSRVAEKKVEKEVKKVEKSQKNLRRRPRRGSQKVDKEEEKSLFASKNIQGIARIRFQGWHRWRGILQGCQAWLTSRLLTYGWSAQGTKSPKEENVTRSIVGMYSHCQR
jgi:hypothetical protein